MRSTQSLRDTKLWECDFHKNRKKGQDIVQISLYFLLISSWNCPLKLIFWWYNARPWDYNEFIAIFIFCNGINWGSRVVTSYDLCWWYVYFLKSSGRIISHVWLEGRNRTVSTTVWFLVSTPSVLGVVQAKSVYFLNSIIVVLAGGSSKFLPAGPEFYYLFISTQYSS